LEYVNYPDYAWDEHSSIVIKSYICRW